MVEEFDLLEEVEVQFCDEECTESVWHGVNYSESLFCREKPKSELTVVIREEGMMYFLTADIKEFAGLCRKHGWYLPVCAGNTGGTSSRTSGSARRWKSVCA